MCVQRRTIRYRDQLKPHTYPRTSYQTLLLAAVTYRYPLVTRIFFPRPCPSSAWIRQWMLPHSQADVCWEWQVCVCVCMQNVCLYGGTCLEKAWHFCGLYAVCVCVRRAVFCDAIFNTYMCLGVCAYVCVRACVQRAVVVARKHCK